MDCAQSHASVVPRSVPRSSYPQPILCSYVERAGADMEIFVAWGPGRWYFATTGQAEGFGSEGHADCEMHE